MTTESDFYETPAAVQLAEAYTHNHQCNCGCDLFFLVCIFLALNI